jgi:hypothetical protein
MAYDIYDEKDYVAGGPSIGGLSDLKDELKRISPATYPQMASLLTYGFAKSPMRLKYEAMALSKQVQSPTVKATLIELGKAAAKSQTIVILHNHLGKDTQEAV